MPQIAFVTEDGPFVPPGSETLKGYNHLDVCVAAADRPSRRENEVIKPTIGFIMGILGD